VVEWGGGKIIGMNGQDSSGIGGVTRIGISNNDANEKFELIFKGCAMVNLFIGSF